MAIAADDFPFLKSCLAGEADLTREELLLESAPEAELQQKLILPH
jgi:hypothetical protein